MAVLINTIGCTGSGKSHLYKQLKEHIDIELVEMDLIRKKLTGSISDQSKNKEVFEQAQRQILSSLKHDKIVFNSATNLGMGNLLKSIEYFISKIPNIEVVLIYMMDSLSKDLCHQRVVDDFDQGKERSDTRDQSIVDKHYNRFVEMRKEHNKPAELYPDCVSVFDYYGSDQEIQNIVDLIDS